jgi:CRISPR/Cas system-associated exonuclease Cas4 (RecB family)
LITSPSAEARLERAREWLARRRRDEEVLIVGGSLDGALELTRQVAAHGPATFGWHRLSLDRLALKLALPELSRLGLSPASQLALEALWARVVHELEGRGQLGRFAAVADRPGLPRALARMMTEARLEGVPARKLDPDLARAAAAFEEALEAAELADRARLLQLAAQAANRLPLCLLDVPAGTLRERELIAALARHSPEVLATAAAGDVRTVKNLEQALSTPAEAVPARADTALGRLQTYLFAAEAPQGRAGEAVTVLSAPGEVRECIELSRLIHLEAARGTPFDQMAVLLRAPGAYRSAITEALRRAKVPAYFARGSRLPDPSGRALLALLGCAEEGLSASRFAEYVSLGEVPWDLSLKRWAPPDPVEAELADADDEEEPEPEEAPVDPDAPVVAGTLRAPRHWEKLLVDASVIGGRDRWEGRLRALENGLNRRRAAPDLEERIAAQLDRDLADLRALRDFALPLLDRLAALPKAATWGRWLHELDGLAARALRAPSRVAALLSELSPMVTVGPVTLREVKRVLSERLLELTRTPRHGRFGQVFVGPIDAARGLSFEVVFAPGLAERIFPQKVREDPVAPDHERRRIGEPLVTDDDRRDAERLQLKLAVGAARRRVVLSYPRLDAHEGRPRVPSFYALDVLKACEGRLPTYEELSQRAETQVHARIGWPAPLDPEGAIDEAERDLSVLGALFRDRSNEAGKARYLMFVNESLSRALRRRWLRFRKSWSRADGLVLPSTEALAALAQHRLEARSFSATALQHFSACPYRFYLSAILRLSPREEPAAIEELDPLQRGSMVHEVQFEVMSALKESWPPPLPLALAKVDEVLERVAGRFHDQLNPAIERVWEDGVDAIRADVREWLRLSLAAGWTPWRFELSFGLPGRENADPDSRDAPAVLDGGLKLRGSIDLVEKSTDGTLTATDYKTGKQRAEGSTRLGGGKTLQPVLYALALEKLFPGVKIEGGSLWYCTQAGHFTKVPIPLDARSRDEAKSAISIVGQAIDKGFLPAAPARDECAYCDFLPACGLGEERRVELKSQHELEALKRLRDLE